MKKPALVLVAAVLVLVLAACTFVPRVGMRERRWLRGTPQADVVYIEGNVTAYRAGGAYYYFRDGRLAKVGPSLVPAGQLGAGD